MALDRISGLADAEGLIFITGGPCEAHCTIGQVECIGMPFKYFEVRREAPEYRVAARGVAQEDRIDAKLGLWSAEHARTERGGEQLASQANTEVGAPRGDSLADCSFLFRKPRVCIFLIGAHASAHDNKQVIVAPIREWFTEVETNTIDLDLTIEEH